MAEPDVRVDTADLDATGAELVGLGTELTDAVRAARALAPGPAGTGGFASVACTARLGARWRETLEHRAADVVASGSAMRAAAASWRETEDAITATLATLATRRAG